jgi:hypothetical protein
MNLRLTLLVTGICATTLPGPVGCAATGGPVDTPTYHMDYRAKLLPRDGSAEVTIHVRQSTDLLREADFAFDPTRMQLVDAEGTTQVTDKRLRWRPPAAGGELKLKVRIDHLRNDSSYDARMTPSWALFRADDVFPAARTITLSGAVSRSRLRIDGPDNWAVVTAYGRGRGEWFNVENPERRFDRPTGWIASGELGVRVDRIGNTEVIIAAPTQQQVRRIDMLALLRWTLPEIETVFGPLPSPLTIVGAGDPMWRGGLSATTSLFIHSGRPLISENGTSTLLHEVMHIAINRGGEDWLLEGLAEYYGLEALVRSGTISPKRFQAAQRQLADWGKQAVHLKRSASSGPATALAVTFLGQLNTRINDATAGRFSLDDVVKALGPGELELEHLFQTANRIAGTNLDELKNTIAARLD